MKGREGGRHWEGGAELCGDTLDEGNFFLRGTCGGKHRRRGEKGKAKKLKREFEVDLAVSVSLSLSVGLSRSLSLCLAFFTHFTHTAFYMGNRTSCEQEDSQGRWSTRLSLSLLPFASLSRLPVAVGFDYI